MITIKTDTTWYELPKDGELWKQKLLEMLHSPGETWIKAFTFSMPELFDEIRKASANGITGHCLLDHTQSTTPGERKVLAQLAEDCKHNWEFIITVAGEDSPHSGYIEHDKAIVVAGDEFECMTGSANLTTNGVDQGNICAYFKSNDWASNFIKEFVEHKNWTLEKHPEWQFGRPIN
jgi:hypothetical protein